MKKILIKASVLALMGFVSVSCKKDNDPAPLTKQNVIDIVNEEFLGEGSDSVGVNTVTFTVSGKRSDSVAYSYTKSFENVIYSNYAERFTSDNAYFYFFPKSSNSGANQLSFDLSGINPGSVKVGDIELISDRIYLNVFEQLTPTSVHTFNVNYLPSGTASPASVSNLVFNASTRILLGNFNIPKRYVNYNYNTVTKKYEVEGSSLQVVNGAFSIYIPNMTIISRKGE